MIYDELRQQAAAYLRRESPGYTLQATALVNEAYLRLVDQTQVNWQTRAHFFGAAANLMRQILIQHARAKHAEKRGGDAQKLYLDEVSGLADNLVKEQNLNLLALDDTLHQLAAVTPQQSRVVELRPGDFANHRKDRHADAVDDALIRQPRTSARQTDKCLSL